MPAWLAVLGALIIPALMRSCATAGWSAAPASRPAGSQPASRAGSALVVLPEYGQLVLTSPPDGVRFDLNADGVPESVAWTDASSRAAFIALDRDDDGAITSGRELFGNQTLPDASDGFSALQRLEPSREFTINSRHPLHARLLLWMDVNHNGRSEPGELRPLAASFSQVGLGYEHINQRDVHANILRHRGWALPVARRDTREGYSLVYDVVLHSIE